MKQISLFEHIANAYSHYDEVDNNTLYSRVAVAANIPKEEMNLNEPIGNDGRKYSKIKREIRWYQQNLKQMGLLEKVNGKRGVWKLTQEGKAKIELHKINTDFQVLAYSTKLGVAIWGDARKVFEKSKEPIHLTLSSPPYPLQDPRAYGNVNEKEFVDWICYILEPIVKNLIEGGSIVLNISNDISLKGSPAKSLYKERLVIAFSDRFGLYKMDEIPWVNTSKIPSNAWATKKKVQMLPAWEPILWFTNNPAVVRADTTQVLKEHSKTHQEYIKNGGSKKEYLNGDGKYHIKKGAFGKETDGSLPKNVFIRGHKSSETMRYHTVCKELDIPAHAAMYPIELPEFFIKFLSRENDLVVDPFFGKGTTGKAAENLNRRWMGSDIMWEYLYGGGHMFDNSTKFSDAFLEAVV